MSFPIRKDVKDAGYLNHLQVINPERDPKVGTTRDAQHHPS